MKCGLEIAYSHGIAHSPDIHLNGARVDTDWISAPQAPVGFNHHLFFGIRLFYFRELALSDFWVRFRKRERPNTFRLETGTQASSHQLKP
jgi:hypothetical protein